MPLRIVVADDHPAITLGISTSLKNLGVEVVDNVRNGERLGAVYKDRRPDVIVMEVRLGGKDALKHLEKLKEEFPDTRVVIYSARSDPTHVARAVALGCNEYILKTSKLEDLQTAIKDAAAGNPPPETSLLVASKSKMQRAISSRDTDIPLTNRELQVLKHVAMGLSNREVGKSLGISVETVKEHVQNILRKLDVNDRTQAAVLAVKRGLV